MQSFGPLFKAVSHFSVSVHPHTMWRWYTS